VIFPSTSRTLSPSCIVLKATSDIFQKCPSSRYEIDYHFPPPFCRKWHITTPPCSYIPYGSLTFSTPIIKDSQKTSLRGNLVSQSFMGYGLIPRIGSCYVSPPLVSSLSHPPFSISSPSMIQCRILLASRFLHAIM